MAEYMNGVLGRLLRIGLVPLVIGAVLVYGSDKLAARFAPGNERLPLVLKAAGGVLAVLGAVLLLL